MSKFFTFSASKVRLIMAGLLRQMNKKAIGQTRQIKNEVARAKNIHFLSAIISDYEHEAREIHQQVDFLEQCLRRENDEMIAYMEKQFGSSLTNGSVNNPIGKTLLYIIKKYQQDDC